MLLLRLFIGACSKTSQQPHSAVPAGIYFLQSHGLHQVLITCFAALALGVDWVTVSCWVLSMAPF